MAIEPPAFSIRPAKADDLDTLFAIHKAALGEYVAATWGWDDAWQFAFFRDQCRPEVRSVIELNGQPVGFIDIAERDGCLWLDNIEIDPQHQGNGIGSAIIHDLLARARVDGVPLKLQVLKVNKRAEALYIRLGFRRIAETATHGMLERRAA